MNPVISAQLHEFSKASSIQSLPLETRFEIYSIFCVINGLLGENIDAYDVHLKGNEFGVDGIAILIQGELVRNRTEAVDVLESVKNPSIEFIFFQSKTSSSYDYGDISKFFDSVTSFFGGSLKGESQAVDDLIEAMEVIYARGIGKRNPKLSCYYIATGNYEQPPRIQSLRAKFRDAIEKMNIFDSKTFVIEMVGARELQQWYRTATTSIEVEIDFPKNVVMPPNANVEEAYIGYIDAGNLLKLYVSHDSNNEIIGINRAVFFDNIRDYDAKSKINYL